MKTKLKTNCSNVRMFGMFECVRGVRCAIMAYHMAVGHRVAAAMVCALCAVGFAAFAAEPVVYLDWDDVNKKMTNATCTTYTIVTASTATFEAGTTYVVQGNVTNATDGIRVEGTEMNPTRLILCDEAKLVVTGRSSFTEQSEEVVGVKTNLSGLVIERQGSVTNALVIYGQEIGTGVLEATGGYNCAGIGGSVEFEDMELVSSNGLGVVTINGGTVTATGGQNAASIREDDTVEFCKGIPFNVVTGETAEVTAPIAQEDYEKDHSAKYVHIEPPPVAQFVKGGEVVAEFNSAADAVKALDDAQYADIEEFRIGFAADTEFDFGGRTNRVVIGNVGAGTNTLKNVLLDGADGGCAVTGSVGTVVFGDGVRIEKEDLGFKQGLVELIIKGGLYKNEPIGYCEGGYLSARRYDENEHLNGLYAVLPAAEIAVEDRKGAASTRYATLQDAFNLIGEDTEVTLRLFNNLKLGTAVAKLEGNKVIRLLPGEPGTNMITRVGAEPVIEIGLEAKLEISNVIFDGANFASEKPMIKVAGKTGTKFGWLIAGDGFVVSNAVGGAVLVGSGGKFELDGVAKIIDNTTGDKPKNVIIEDSAAIQLTACGAVTNGNYAQIGVWSDKPKLMVAGRQFGTVNTS
ncbi:MAG: hypothetical protein KBT68_05925, partial [bacterium]|nr:hypothetical protein [Candidatus Colisoma equi]